MRFSKNVKLIELTSETWIMLPFMLEAIVDGFGSGRTVMIALCAGIYVNDKNTDRYADY